jgi:hypothetical protein
MQRPICGQILLTPRKRNNAAISVSGPRYWFLIAVARFFT